MRNSDPSTEKERRLTQALRENLKKRKIRGRQPHVVGATNAAAAPTDESSASARDPAEHLS